MSIFTDFDAAYGNGYYTGIPSADGSTDVFHNGTVVDNIMPMHGGIGTGFEHGDFVIKTTNHDGGTDTFKNGHHIQHTQDNVFGGHDVYDGSHHLQEVSIPNVEGGMDFYDGSMHQTGMSMDNIYGGEDYLSSGSNINDILNYSDPLGHVSDYKMTPFNPAKV